MRTATAFAVAVGVVGMNHPARALGTSDPWIAASGNWSTPANWQFGVPAGSYLDASIDFTTTAQNVVTYDYSGTPVTLTSFFLGEQTSSGSATLSQANFNLSVGGIETIANNATYNLSGGTNLITGSSANLSIGTTVPNVVSNCNISGTGTLIAPAVVIGSAAGTGVLNVSGSGTLNVSGGTTVNAGTLLQTGGTQTAGSFISVAPIVGLCGACAITGGSLTVNEVTVGASFNAPGTPGGTGTFNLGPAGSLYMGSQFINRGTTVLDGNQYWSANSFFINFAGTTAFDTDAGLHGQNLSVDGFAGSVVFAVTQHLYSLDLLGGTAQVTGAGNGQRSMLYTKSLSIVQSGTLDITNNDVDLQAGGPASLSSDWSLIQQGYNGGAWNGSGITSSTAAHDTTHLTAVGVILNLNSNSSAALYTTFDNASVAVNDVLVKFTYYGDTDLSGKIDGTDYGRVDVAYLADRSHPTAMTGWFNGDFNYDGTVNGSDYTLMDNAFNMQTGVLDDQIASPTAAVAGTAVGTAVPEPATLGLVAMGVIGLLGRRMRRRKARPCGTVADILFPCRI